MAERIAAMAYEPISVKRAWARKFHDAVRGVREGMRDQSSFIVHFFTALLVIVAGFAFHVNLTEWCLLVLAIASVLTTELINSALESMAKAITGTSDPHLGNSLDIGSAAVLCAATGASVVGTLIFGNHLGILLGWW
jgi:diacylglycerol kinase